MNVLQDQNNCILYVNSFLEHWYIFILLFWYQSVFNLLYLLKLCNIRLLLFEKNSRNYHYTEASHWRKNIVAVIPQDRVIDDNLKRQIKNRTLYICRLWLLICIFQYISNWPTLFEHLSTLFLQYTLSNNFLNLF